MSDILVVKLAHLYKLKRRLFTAFLGLRAIAQALAENRRNAYEDEIRNLVGKKLGFKQLQILLFDANVRLDSYGGKDDQISIRHGEYIPVGENIKLRFGDGVFRIFKQMMMFVEQEQQYIETSLKPTLNKIIKNEYSEDWIACFENFPKLLEWMKNDLGLFEVLLVDLNEKGHLDNALAARETKRGEIKSEVIILIGQGKLAGAEQIVNELYRTNYGWFESSELKIMNRLVSALESNNGQEINAIVGSRFIRHFFNAREYGELADAIRQCMRKLAGEKIKTYFARIDSPVDNNLQMDSEYEFAGSTNVDISNGITYGWIVYNKLNGKSSFEVTANAITNKIKIEQPYFQPGKNIVLLRVKAPNSDNYVQSDPKIISITKKPGASFDTAALIPAKAAKVPAVSFDFEDGAAETHATDKKQISPLDRVFFNDARFTLRIIFTAIPELPQIIRASNSYEEFLASAQIKKNPKVGAEILRFMTGVELIRRIHNELANETKDASAAFKQLRTIADFFVEVLLLEIHAAPSRILEERNVQALSAPMSETDMKIVAITNKFYENVHNLPEGDSGIGLLIELSGRIHLKLDPYSSFQTIFHAEPNPANASETIFYSKTSGIWQWLICESETNNEYLIVPFWTNSTFGVEWTINVAKQLFSGIPANSRSMKFGKVYRAARLRKITAENHDGYTILSRGYLTLKGEAPSQPVPPEPITYEQLTNDSAGAAGLPQNDFNSGLDDLLHRFDRKIGG